MNLVTFVLLRKGKQIAGTVPQTTLVDIKGRSRRNVPSIPYVGVLQHLVAPVVCWVNGEQQPARVASSTRNSQNKLFSVARNVAAIYNGVHCKYTQIERLCVYLF